MEMLNRAIEGADLFKKMMEKIERNAPAPTGPENRAQRRKRERDERRTAKRTKRVAA